MGTEATASTAFDHEDLYQALLGAMRTTASMAELGVITSLLMIPVLDGDAVSDPLIASRMAMTLKTPAFHDLCQQGVIKVLKEGDDTILSVDLIAITPTTEPQTGEVADG